MRSAGLRADIRCRGAAKSPGLQIAEQTVHPAGPVGAVGLFREAICLQDIADLTAGAGDLESYSTGTTMHDAISECASNIQKSAVVLNSASGKAGRFLMPELV